jgi:hypothetical protein
MKKWVLALTTVLLILSTLYFSSFEINVSAALGSTIVVIHPIADAFVNSSSTATNYGTAGSMYVSANSELDYAYIKFDLSILPPNANIISANLSVYLSSKGGTVYFQDSIGAYYCSDNSWTENGITWNNKPSSNPIPTSSWSFPSVFFYEYKSWSITPDVTTALPSGILTEMLKFTSKTGDGYALYQSREGANQPTLYVEYTLMPILSSFNLQFATNNVKVIYPSDNSTKPLGCVAAWVSDWTSSAFVTTKLQHYTEGLDINSSFVDPTSGSPLGVSGIGIVSFGGPVVNPVVKYAEGSGTPSENRAPIKFYSDAGIFYFQHSNGSSITGANLPASVINNNQDMFIIEVYLDGGGRYIMLSYGFGWKGTYAAGKYFDTTIYPNLASYTISWIVVKWQDTNGDSFVNNPGDGDTYTVISSST